ncbi:MAG: hypothetical protein IPK16_14920 [Anaerolineales bacterium]|nr:hypothetical protein [Anaerolineales bacterium]
MKRKSLMWIAALVLVTLAVVPQALLAQTGNTWTVQFFNNPNWAGTPTLVQYTSYIDFNWGTNPPGAGMPADNWTATMTTSAYFYAGAYSFNALADDEISLQIDGVTYINTMGAGMSGKPVATTVNLSQGYHNLVVQYRQYTDTAYVYLTWAYTSGGGSAPPPPPPPPGPTATPAPATCNPSWSCTCPTQATSVTTDYGDYTNCIQQNLPQSQCFVSNGQWNSPNMGSITSEPNIVVWGACTPGTIQTMQLYCNQAPQQATCSKTGAGWFAY